MSDALIRKTIEALGFHAHRVRAGEREFRREVVDREVPEPIANALEQASEQGLLVLVQFHADWCAPCKVIEKLLVEQEVQQALAGFVLVSLDLDEYEDAGRGYGIDAMPTLLALDSHGKEIRRIVGVLSAAKLAEGLLEVAAESQVEDR